MPLEVFIAQLADPTPTESWPHKKHFRTVGVVNLITLGQTVWACIKNIQIILTFRIIYLYSLISDASSIVSNSPDNVSPTERLRVISHKVCNAYIYI